jgi:hypothetical protein
MTTTTAPRSRVAALARVEALRYARHPVFLLGAVLWAVTTAVGINNTRDDYYAPPMSAAVFLGVFGIVVGFRLMRSLERSAEALEVAPASMQERVGALLLASVVPGVLGMVGAVACLTLPDLAGDWVYGTWSPSERVAIFVAMAGVSSFGGPLLGIAAARWLRFPGAVVVPIVAVVAWVIVGNGWTASNQDSLGWLLVRLFSPFSFFTTLDDETLGAQHALESWRGNPFFFLVWVLLLCAFAAVVALLKEAEGASHQALRRTLLVVVVAALASYALAVVTGPDHATLRSPQGVTRT